MDDQVDQDGHDTNIDWERLARYLAGHCPATESAEIERWADSRPEHRALLDDLGLAWSIAPLVPARGDVDRAWERTIAACRAAARVSRILSGTPHCERAAVWRAAIAASVAAIGVAGVLAYGFGRASTLPGSTQTNAMQTVVTAPAQRALLTLPDGTRIALGVASTLRYARVFGETRRDVYLQGEAVFDVVHDPRRPFVVHVAGASVEDLGTRFAVEAYLDAPVRVAVVAGHVRVTTPRSARQQREPAKPLSLNPGDLVRIAADGTEELARGADMEPYVALTEGRLVFSGTPFRDALPALGRWYDLDVRLADPDLGHLRLTASFKDEPIEAVLAAVSAALGLRVERHGRVVTFARTGKR